MPLFGIFIEKIDKKFPPSSQILKISLESIKNTK